MYEYSNANGVTIQDRWLRSRMNGNADLAGIRRTQKTYGTSVVESSTTNPNARMISEKCSGNPKAIECREQCETAESVGIELHQRRYTRRCRMRWLKTVLADQLPSSQVGKLKSIRRLSGLKSMGRARTRLNAGPVSLTKISTLEAEPGESLLAEKCRLMAECHHGRLSYERQ